MIARRKPSADRVRKKGSAVKNPTMVLFGDSHSYAVQRAIEKRQGSGVPVALKAHRLAKIKNGVRQGDTSFEEFLEIARTLDADDVVLSMIGGNQHAVFSTIQHARGFDFFGPDEPSYASSEGVEVVPYRMLTAVFERGIRNGDGKSLEALRKATTARLIHIIPPPPKKDNAFIQRYHESHFAKEGIADAGVSSPNLRLKFWKLQTRILQKVCAELGIEVMLPPSAALDDEGYLAPDYYASDATHANYAYGEMTLREIENAYQPRREGAEA